MLAAQMIMLAAACTSSTPEERGPDSSASDAAIDASGTVSSDARSDATTDASIDSDATPESGSDAMADAYDARAEAGADAASDVGADGSEDAEPDVAIDVTGEAATTAHSCLGAPTSTDGPTTLASGARLTSLASDGLDVFFADRGSAAQNYADAGIKRVNLAGGSAVVLVTGELRATDLAVDAVNVYWSDEGAGAVMACAKSGCGGTPTVLASLQAAPRRTITDGSFVYFATDAGVVRCAVAGCGSSPTLLTSTTPPTNSAMAVDSQNVYWVSPAGALLSCSTSGCPSGPTTLAVSTDATGGIVSTGTEVVWAEWRWPGRVLKCGADGCSGAPIVLASQQDTLTGLAVVGRDLYWANSDRVGEVLYCSLDGCGGEPTELASGAFTPLGMVATAERVAWLDVSSAQAVVSCSTCGCNGAPRRLARVVPGSSNTHTNLLGDVVLAHGHLAWLDFDVLGVAATYGRGAVYACDVTASCGSSVTVLAGSQSNLNGLTPTDEGVAWISPLAAAAAPSTIVAASLAAPTLRMVSSSEQQPYAITSDATHIYWVDGGDAPEVSEGGAGPNTYTNGTVKRAPLGGGIPEVLASALVGTGAMGVAVDATGVYWTDGVMVRTVPLAGGSATTLVTGSRNAYAILADGEAAYWYDKTASGTIWRLGHGDGAPTPLCSALNVDASNSLDKGAGAMRTLAMDSDHVYWTEQGTTPYRNGRVMRVSKTGGSASIVTQGQYIPRGLWVEGGFVYYTTAMGTVMRAVAGP